MLDYSDPTGIYAIPVTELWKQRSSVSYGGLGSFNPEGMGKWVQFDTPPPGLGNDAIALANQIKSAADRIGQAVSSAKAAFPNVDSSEIDGLPDQAQTAAFKVDSILNDSSGGNSVTGIQAWYAQHPGANPYVKRDVGIVSDAVQKLNQILSQIRSMGSKVSQWRAQQAAQATALAQQQQQQQQQQQAQATALAQQAQDQQTLAGALSQAQVLAGQGDFDNAISVLQSSSVTAAATRLNRTGDVATVLQQVTYAKKQYDAKRQQCTASGGTWDGTACDMSKANAAAAAAASARVDSAIQRAQALSSAGNYVGALLVLSGASADAAASNRSQDIQLIQAQIQGDQQAAAEAKKQADAAAAQAQQQAAACLQAGGTWNGTACDMSAVQTAKQTAQAQTACLQAGGTWNGTACDMSAVQAAKAQTACFQAGGNWVPDGQGGGSCDMSMKQAQQQAQLLQQFAPVLAQSSGGANLLAQALARLFGVQPAGPDVATTAPGMPTSIVAGRSPYGESFGPENF